MAGYRPKVGDKFARVSHGTIVGIDGGSYRVRNTAGFEWRIGGDIVEREFHIAGHEVTAKKVRPSDFERIFKESVGENVFKVTFTKKPAQDDGVAAIDAADWTSASQAKKRKVVRAVLQGETRTLVGRLKINAFEGGKENPEKLGRMQVIDMDKEAAGEDAERQVDLRTVTELVVGGVRYHL